MHDAISNAQKDPKLWRTLRRTGFEKVFYIRYERHFIFFRVLSGGVLGIISILHERMDILARPKEDVNENITARK